MNNKNKVYFLFILFISGLFMVPILGESSSIASENILIDESVESGIMPRDIRVAIYNEPNFTAPAYASAPGGMHNNVTYLQDVFEAAGYDVDLLDVHDIYNHTLKTADYDVLVLADNFPRENITTQVMNFYNGGGGILSFDGSGGFLCYFGILPPAAVDTSGSGAYWDYNADDLVSMNRHPVTKSYPAGQTIDTNSGYLVWDWIALSGTTISGDLTRLATSSISPNDASILAFDPSNGGGKVVSISFDLVNDVLPELEPLYVDAIDWLTPRPKGRVLFDLTHEPYYGVDAGEPVGYDQEARYDDLRDELVSKTFTFDKLYLNDTPYLTSDILEKYDMLIINCPEIAYTAEEITVIQSWVADGGGLFLMGEWNSFEPDNERIRQIIDGYDLNITDTQYSGSPYTTTNITLHPATEAVVTLEFSGGSFVESWGDAFSLVKNMTSGDELVVAQEIGEGRVVLLGDINILSNYIANEDNNQFGYNIANWLCSGGAKILLFTDGKQSLGANYNFYRSPAALALNELGVNYYMSNDRDYFNESLKLQSWDLLIIDSNNQAPVTSHSLIRDHIEAGGRVIWRDFLFKLSTYDSMWNYLGWAGHDGSYTTGPPTVYAWDAGHSVFNLPVSYGADNFTSTVNQFSTDYVNVTLFDNATAIAGVSPSYNENTTAIVLSHGDRVLCNMFAISEYLDDTDDSTYADGYELFLNEIVFMLRPSVDHPSDVEYTEGDTGNNIVWAGYGGQPFAYSIEMDSTSVHGDDWDGGAVSYNVDGLTNGTYIFDITLVDDLGRSVSDSVTVTVLPYIAPTNSTTTSTGGGDAPLDPTLILILAGAAGVVIIIIIIIVMKKK